MINRDGPAGTVAAFRSAANPVAAMTGPEPGSPLGTQAPDQAPGHGAAMDSMLASHEARLQALESPEAPGPADGESEPGE